MARCALCANAGAAVTRRGVISRGPTFFALQQAQANPACLQALPPPAAARLRPMATATAPVKAGFWALTLGSIGVVYGDIGTSPLYALRESVLAAVGAGNAGERAGGARRPVADHLGADRSSSPLKYVLILLRADNNGEGGTLALMALAQRALGRQRRRDRRCSASSAARCSTATPSSRRRCRCSRRSKA